MSQGQGSFEFEMPTDFSGPKGNYLKVGGWFHLQITKIDDRVEKHPGAFEASAAVLAGTVEGQEKKEVKLTFYPPKFDGKDKGEMARRKMANFGRATNLLPIQPEPGKRYNADLMAAVGHQCVAQIEMQKADDGKEYARLAYDDIYHVDDPAVKDIPKAAAVLATLPPQLRHKAEEFPSREPQAAAPTTPAGTVDLSDI